MMVFARTRGIHILLCLLLWQHGMQIMPIGNRMFSVVAYTPTREDNSKRLRCVAENPNIVGSSIEASYNLDVHCELI